MIKVGSYIKHDQIFGPKLIGFVLERIPPHDFIATTHIKVYWPASDRGTTIEFEAFYEVMNNE